MKIKAILFAAAIFGATLFATQGSENVKNNDPIQKQAIEKARIIVPTHG